MTILFKGGFYIGNLIYKTNDIELWSGDCLEVMKEIPDGTVDLILCDLPYGTTQCKWDIVIPLEQLWEQYKRVIKKRGAIALFGIEPFSSMLRMSNLQMYKYDWVWDKHNTTGFLNAKKKPLSRYEIVSVFSSQKLGNFTYNPQMSKGKLQRKAGGHNKKTEIYSDYKDAPYVNDIYYPTSIIDVGTVYRNKNVHPTQKPVALLEYLIKTYTNENETVLDSTMGSGSTGVAAINTNRRFIGIEIDPTYCGIAKERIQHVVSDMS